VTSDKDHFINFEKPKISYCPERLTENEFWIKPVNLLFETGIEPQVIECFTLGDYIAFYKTTECDFPFDILAASFYLMCRYEEYLPHKKDELGRYAFSNSLACKQDFLDRPLVNIWLKELKKRLQKKFSDLYFSYVHFKFIPSYDIDKAYDYVDLGWKQNIKADLQSVLTGKWTEIKTRNAVLNGNEKDNFDAYEWLDALHLYCRLKPYYFFLLSSEPKGYDNNIDPTNPALQQLIEYHAAGNTIGMHPSWQSGDDEQLLIEEKELLEYLSGKAIISSRQHCIRFNLPHTYRTLIDLGIANEYSMGYGNINGFRASIASSFYWFDLEKNEQTNLLLYPFCFMDATAYYEQKFTVQQAFKQLMYYYNEIKNVNGLMVTVWHNHFLGTDPQFSGWRDMYEIFLKEEVYWD
jgi:hypothetical protein